MIRFFRKHYASHTRGIVAAAGTTAVGAMAEASVLVLLVPLAEQATLEGEEVSGRLSMFRIELSTGQMLATVLALVVVSALAKVVALWARSKTVQSWERRERVRALRALLEAEYEYTAQLSPAELQTIVGGHVSQAAQGLSVIGQIANAAISLTVLILVAFSTAPLAALIIAVVGAGLLGLMRPLARRTRREGKTSSEFGIEAGRLVADTARDGREIRLYGAQDHFIDRYRQAVQRHEEVRLRISMSSGLAPILYQGAGLFLVVVALGVALTISQLDVTTIGAVALLFLRSLGYGQQLTNTQQQYSHVVPFVERLDEELDALHSATARYGDRELGRVESIELVEVSYHYRTGDDADAEVHPALTDVGLTLRSPSVVGLAGASGSGKSTLAQLLLRLRRPTLGRLLVNGHDIADYSRRSWTRQVALVPQYPQLIRGTARENIEFFRPDLTGEDVDRVVRAVGLHELFASLPNGYETQLGETGRELSGGQLQRVGIARALIDRPSLLVLDEPTSALDSESEQWVERAIREVSHETLVVIISHRPSTLEVCDRIIRLGDGRVLADVDEAVTNPSSPVGPAGSSS